MKRTGFKAGTKPKKEPITNLLCRIPVSHYQALKALSERNKQISMSAMVREAVKEWLEKEGMIERDA